MLNTLYILNTPQYYENYEHMRKVSLMEQVI